MKKCRKCVIEKELNQFSPNKKCRQGVANICKPCNAFEAKERREKNPGYAALIQKEYRKRNPEKIKEYAKKCWKDPEKRKKKQEYFNRWIIQNPDYYKKWYWSKDLNRYKKLEYRKKWLKLNPNYAKKNLKIQKSRHPEKHKARLILRKNVYEGKVIKPINCEKCMKVEKRIEGHHNDYNKPLEVVWLCVSCHKNLHRKEV